MEKYKTDVLVLLEVGAVDLELGQKVFVNFKFFYQKGENSWGGVLLIFKVSLPVVRVKCDIPSVCIADIKCELPVRIIGVYAPKSKTWNWNDLSQYITDQCCIFGDFNLDLVQQCNKKEVNELLHWSDSLALNTTIPSYPTSLRSDRTIDYTFNRGISLTLQTCDDNTTSDHKPLIGVISCEIKENTLGSNIHWKVFH
jgi:hypothetical protein